MPSLIERDSSEEKLCFPSMSAISDGVSEGTGTRWVDCFLVRTGIDGGGDDIASMDREGTGGGDWAFSRALKSLMKPLLFLLTVFNGGAVCGPSPNPSTCACRSTADAEVSFFAFAPALVVRVLLRPPEPGALCAWRDVPGSTGAEIGVPLTVALRDRSRA